MVKEVARLFRQESTRVSLQCWVRLSKAYTLSAVSRIRFPSSCLCHYPSLSHPAARLWRGAGLTSLLITEAAWVTSGRLDSPLWWVGTLGRWCIWTETYKGHTDGLWSCCWRMFKSTCHGHNLHMRWTCICMFYYEILSIPPILSVSPSWLCVCRCSISGFRFGRFMELAQGSRARGWEGDTVYIYIYNRQQVLQNRQHTSNISV